MNCVLLEVGIETYRYNNIIVNCTKQEIVKTIHIYMIKLTRVDVARRTIRLFFGRKTLELAPQCFIRKKEHKNKC
jgi:hypothetical protein